MTDIAVVIVSGGRAESPFTTPTQACATGFAAGNTDTALREHLLAEGHAVYTSPAMVGGGVARSSSEFGGFADGPDPLPAEVTVDSIGPLDTAGERLAAFFAYLHETDGVDTFDVVAHSMGGLFSRAAIAALQRSGSSLRFRSLTTIGTPWQGAFGPDFRLGDIDLELAGGDATVEAIMREIRDDPTPSNGGRAQVTWRYLMDGGWNARHAGVLDDIPVTLIAGDRLRLDGGDPRVWPNDGIVTAASALAVDVDADVVPNRRDATFPDVHSIFVADQLGLPWHTALTWDPDVLAFVAETIRSSDKLP